MINIDLKEIYLKNLLEIHVLLGPRAEKVTEEHVDDRWVPKKNGA